MDPRVDVLLGAQWGDEGKGKVVDVIAPRYDVIARFQGGPNAGHTLMFEGRKHVLHTIPSGVFHEGTLNLVGNGVVIDPVIFMKEIDALAANGHAVSDRLLISRRAHLILPTHRALDAASEAEKGKEKIGSTLKGIGPTYMDKTGRNGLRVGDLELPDLKERYAALVRKHERLLGSYSHVAPWQEAEAEWHDAVARLRNLRTVDCEHYLDQALRDGKRILAEGAQGTLLDIDFGTYPFVTSSNTIAAGACTGLGVPPARIGRVIGIFKAYCTRVGSGPFPTELLDGTGERIRHAGREFGSTTGRPRRCGWLDAAALKRAIVINGVSGLCITKLDVLDGLAEIQVCVGYELDGRSVDILPLDADEIQSCRPVYEVLPGWSESTAGLIRWAELPANARRYLERVQQLIGAPIDMVSTGPDRVHTILLRHPFRA